MIEPEWYKGREQTFVKHFFLERYLEKVAYVTLAGGGWSEFTYVDAFSGPWRSASDEFKDTSVFLALTKLDAVRQKLEGIRRTVTFRALFVEQNASAYRDLQSLVARFPNLEARTICGEFQNHVDEARCFINNAFSLLFVDPTGWSVDLELLKPLLRLWGEVIVNFMYNDINRHLDNPRPGVSASFDRIFGGVSWRDEITRRIADGEDREAAIIGVFCDRLRATGSFEYVTSTRIMWPLANRPYFYLVYATRHWRGVEEFRRVEEKALEVQEKVRFDAKLQARERRSGMPDLFRSESPSGPTSNFVGRRERSLHSARGRLLKLLERKHEFKAYEAFGRMLELPLVFPDDAEELLAEAQKEGRLTFLLGPRQREVKADTLIKSLMCSS